MAVVACPHVMRRLGALQAVSACDWAASLFLGAWGSAGSLHEGQGITSCIPVLGMLLFHEYSLIPIPLSTASVVPGWKHISLVSAGLETGGSWVSMRGEPRSDLTDSVNQLWQCWSGWQTRLLPASSTGSVQSPDSCHLGWFIWVLTLISFQ